MAKRNTISSNGELGVKDEEVLVDSEAQEVLPEAQSPSYVPLRLRIPARYITNGSVSGTRYVFEGAGSVVEVLSEDAPELLAKKRKHTCCNGTPQQNIFEQVGEI